MTVSRTEASSPHRRVRLGHAIVILMEHLDYNEAWVMPERYMWYLELDNVENAKQSWKYMKNAK